MAPSALISPLPGWHLAWSPRGRLWFSSRHETDIMTTYTIDDQAAVSTAALRRMTSEQLRHLGTQRMVYLKAGMRDGELSFVLFDADGTPLVMVDSFEQAIEMAGANGFQFVTVH
jgi:hypothetical protein